MRQLPTFKGYIVDNRLSQFRKVDYGKKSEFVDFVSKRGKKLLEELRAEGSFTTPEVYFEWHNGWVEITVTCAHCGHVNGAITFPTA